jgi:hypothetical protein
MELDEKKINELLDAIMLKARDNRTQIPYSREDSFPQCVLFIGPNFEPAAQPVTWRNEDEKYHMMRGVSEVAKEMLCRAIILVTDTRWTNSDEVQQVLGIKPIKEIGLEEWRKQYSHIVTTKYGGYLKNMPRQCWHEAILVVAKGPEFKGKIPMRMARYERGHGDTIHWLPPMKPEDEYRASEFNLLPDWWV